MVIGRKSSKFDVGERFHVLRTLGQGTLGIVYLCEDRFNDNNLVALKAIRQKARGERSNEFLRHEFQQLSHLSHPNIVQAYDFGGIAGGDDIFFTEEYVRGQEFGKALSRATFDEFIDAFVQVCRGLHYLHCRNIRHGDLKPENVVVWLSNEGPVVKIIDLHLSFYCNQKLDRSYGTILYMPPEVIRREPADGRADIYSLGMMCYELLAGRRAFHTGDFKNIYLSQLFQTPTSLAVLRPDLPRSICLLIDSMIRKEPEQRPQSAADIISFIKHFINPKITIETRDLMRHYFDKTPYFDFQDKLRYAMQFLILGARDVHEHSEVRPESGENNSDSVISEIEHQFMLIVGPYGTGKSRLLNELHLISRLRRQFTCFLSFSSPEAHELEGFTDIFGQCVQKFNLPHYRDRYFDSGSISQSRIAAQGPLADVLLQEFVELTQFHWIVLIVDDLARADAASLEFLDRLLDSSAQILVVAGSDRHKIAGLERQPDKVIELNYLNREQSERFVSSLLCRTLPIPVMDLLFEQSQGRSDELVRLSQQLINDGSLQDTLSHLEIDFFHLLGAPQGRSQVQHILDRSQQLSELEIKLCALLLFIGRAVEFSAIEQLFGEDFDADVLRRCPAIDQFPGRPSRYALAAGWENVVIERYCNVIEPHDRDVVRASFAEFVTLEISNTAETIAGNEANKTLRAAPTHHSEANELLRFRWSLLLGPLDKNPALTVETLFSRATELGVTVAVPTWLVQALAIQQTDHSTENPAPLRLMFAELIAPEASDPKSLRQCVQRSGSSPALSQSQKAELKALATLLGTQQLIREAELVQAETMLGELGPDEISHLPADSTIARALKHTQLSLHFWRGEFDAILVSRGQDKFAASVKWCRGEQSEIGVDHFFALSFTPVFLDSPDSSNTDVSPDRMRELAMRAMSEAKHEVALGLKIQLARQFYIRADYKAAQDQLDQGLNYARHYRCRFIGVIIRLNSAQIALDLGQFEQANLHLTAANDSLKELKCPWLKGLNALLSGRYSRLIESREQSIRALQLAEQHFSELSFVRGLLAVEIERSLAIPVFDNYAFDETQLRCATRDQQFFVQLRELARNQNRLYLVKANVETAESLLNQANSWHWSFFVDLLRCLEQKLGLTPEIDNSVSRVVKRAVKLEIGLYSQLESQSQGQLNYWLDCFGLTVPELRQMRRPLPGRLDRNSESTTLRDVS